MKAKKKRSMSRPEFLMPDLNDRETAAFEEGVSMALMMDHLQKYRGVEGLPDKALQNILKEKNSILLMCKVHKFITRGLKCFAFEGDELAAYALWEASLSLIETIHALARENPDVLKLMARRSLFMPSRRSKVKRFTDNFHEIQERIELSKDCMINTDSEALFDLDNETTLAIALALEQAGRLRDRMRGLEQVWREHSSSGDTPKCTLEEWLIKVGGFERKELFLQEMPDYNKATEAIWWTKLFKPMLESKGFLEGLRKTKMYDRLCKAARSSKDYDVIDEVKKRYRLKLKSLAPSSHKPPSSEGEKSVVLSKTVHNIRGHEESSCSSSRDP